MLNSSLLFPWDVEVEARRLRDVGSKIAFSALSHEEGQLMEGATCTAVCGRYRRETVGAYGNHRGDVE